jgi:hypothetical protein
MTPFCYHPTGSICVFQPLLCIGDVAPCQQYAAFRPAFDLGHLPWLHAEQGQNGERWQVVPKCSLRGFDLRRGQDEKSLIKR